MRISTLLAATVFTSGIACAEIDYNFDVRPILSDRCFHCHGLDAGKRKAKLRLDTREGAREVIEAGELLARISSHDPDEVMPPPESKLSLKPGEIGTLRQWVAEGFKYKDHWAFLPVKRPAGAGAASSIDGFVEARLASEGLELQPESTKQRLIRRVAFDLTGLPPSIEEIDAFLADGTPDAYDKMVDRFLAKPAFGERMASYWMDLSRYSDTYGYQVDRDRFVWPWRDWVIRAFNANKPYDQFVVEQLAGDMLADATDDQVLATTFNRLHPQKVEGGSTEEEFRVEYVADRLHTFGTAFLGLTLECCRCHDHKYDPVLQKEYYQLFSYFQNIDESGLYSYFTNSVPTPTLAMMDDAKRAQAEKLRAEVAAKEAALSAVTDVEGRFAEWAKSAPALEPGGQVAHLDFEGGQGGGNESVPGKVGKAVKLSGDDAVGTPVGNFKRTQPFSVALWMQTPDRKTRAVVFHRSRAWTDAASRGYEMLIEEGRLKWSLIHFWPGNAISVQAKRELPVGEWQHVVVSYDGSSLADGLKIYVNGEAAEFELVRDHLTKNITGGGGDKIAIGERFRDRGFTGGLVDEFRVFDRALLPSEVRNLAKGDPIAADLALYRDRFDAEVAAAREALSQARAARAGLQDGLQEIMVMREMAKPKPAFVLNRGAYDQRGAEVVAGTPAVLPPSGASNRLELANWLVSREHPLTSRVAVNRLWQICFGAGLVRTPEDFGSQGELPTHPELLDWLAAEFMESGWDMKRLFKMMLSSRTYRQGSEALPELLERDPGNRLLARAPSFRLPAEMLRDQWLAASGLLATAIGGPSVKPYEVTESFKPMGRDKGAGLYRRSLYTFWKRTAPAPVMMAFDASKRDVCTVKRERTQTPLQALVLLNDPQMNEAARVLGEKMLKKHGTANDAMLGELFRRATGRTPSAEERGVMAKLYAEQVAEFISEPKAARAFLKVGDAPSEAGLDPAQVAAAGVLAAAALNLWESVARL